MTTDAADNVDDAQIARPEPLTDTKRTSSRGRIGWVQIGAISLALAAAGTGTAVYFGGYREDRAKTQAADDVTGAASQAVIALLSYAPDSLDHDLMAARTHLTGEFLTYYSQFADHFIAPAAKQKGIHATASVTRSATIDVDTRAAHVLVFLNQTTTSRDSPTPTQTASSVNVGMTKVDGMWRISSFDPI